MLTERVAHKLKCDTTELRLADRHVEEDATALGRCHVVRIAMTRFVVSRSRSSKANLCACVSRSSDPALSVVPRSHVVPLWPFDGGLRMARVRSVLI